VLHQGDGGPHALEAQGLVKHFGAKRAVDGVSLAVPRSSIFGLLGPNGAGKTTTLRMLLGIIDPDEGERRLLGRSRPLEAASEVGYLPEERGLYPAMTAREAIAFMGALRGLPIREGRARAEAMLAERGLADWTQKPIRTLSKGMAQTVQLLGTLVHRPRLIVLDEPFSGLDAINQEKLEALIRAEAEAGATVIFSTRSSACVPGRRTGRGALPFLPMPAFTAANGASNFPRADRSPCFAPFSKARQGSRPCRSSAPAFTMPSWPLPARLLRPRWAGSRNRHDGRHEPAFRRLRDRPPRLWRDGLFQGIRLLSPWATLPHPARRAVRKYWRKRCERRGGVADRGPRLPGRAGPAGSREA
jgi:ABC-type Na+ transport system ATPase subunit NatA